MLNCLVQALRLKAPSLAGATPGSRQEESFHSLLNHIFLAKHDCSFIKWFEDVARLRYVIVAYDKKIGGERRFFINYSTIANTFNEFDDSTRQLLQIIVMGGCYRIAEVSEGGETCL